MAEADIEAAAAIQVDAFGGVLADIDRRATTTDRAPPSATRGSSRRAARSAAVAISFPLRWWFRGQSYPTSAIAGVAVRPVDRRRRLAHDLMHAILQADMASGPPVFAAVSVPARLLSPLGYGSAGLMHFWRLPIAHLRDEPALRAHVRQLREADRPGEASCSRARCGRRPEGGLERNPGQWQRRWTQDETWLVYDEGGTLDGYLAYRPAPNTLEVRELVAATSEAERGLWSFVAAQIEQRASATLPHADRQAAVGDAARAVHVRGAAARLHHQRHGRA